MAVVPVSSGISQIQGHVPEREDFLLLGCGFPSHLISPGPPSCSQGHRSTPGLSSPTASEHRHLGISLPTSVGVAARSRLGTVPKGKINQ